MTNFDQIRAQLLPARLNSLFVCPNYIIAPNPAGLILGQNYIRPAALIEPTPTTLDFPLWMPFGKFTMASEGLINRSSIRTEGAKSNEYCIYRVGA